MESILAVIKKRLICSTSVELKLWKFEIKVVI